MAIITNDKIVLIVGVTVVIIILAYFFRFGQFRRREKPGMPPANSTSA